MEGTTIRQWRESLFRFPKQALILGGIFFFGTAIAARFIDLDLARMTMINAAIVTVSILIHLFEMARALRFMRRINKDLDIPMEVAWCVYLVRNTLRKEFPDTEWTHDWLMRRTFAIARQYYDV